MPEFNALVESLNQKIGHLEEDLDKNQQALNSLVKKLPKDYIPRDEADEKAEKIREWAISFIAVGLAILLAVIGLVFWVKGEVRAEGIARCKEDRTALNQVVNIAVADRRPLTTTTPEAARAIEEQNETLVRPLRNKLLALDGTQPEKC